MVLAPAASAASFVTSIKQKWSSDEVQDKLDQHGATDERMVDLAAIERRALSSSDIPHNSADGESVAKDVETRQVAMWILDGLVRFASLPPTHMLKAGILLDVYRSRKQQALADASVPALCVALVSMVTKFDTSEPVAPVGGLRDHASCLTGILKNKSYGQINKQEVMLQEHAILSALHWSIDLPTVQDWVTLVCTRLNEFMFNMLAPALTPVWERCNESARILAMHRPSTTDFSPLHVSQGLICLNLVSGRVLPASAFGLTELASPLSTSKSGKNAPAFNPRSVELLLQSLERATGSDRSTLSKDAHLVNEALLDLR